MVHYCYTMDYPNYKSEQKVTPGESMESSDISRICTNAQSYALAEIHDMSGLNVLPT